MIPWYLLLKGIDFSCFWYSYFSAEEFKPQREVVLLAYLISHARALTSLEWGILTNGLIKTISKWFVSSKPNEDAIT